VSFDWTKNTCLADTQLLTRQAKFLGGWGYYFFFAAFLAGFFAAFLAVAIFNLLF
jgi:hypothetical protein